MFHVILKLTDHEVLLNWYQKVNHYFIWDEFLFFVYTRILGLSVGVAKSAQLIPSPSPIKQGINARIIRKILDRFLL